MQITSMEGYLAQCEAKGVGRTVNLFLLQGSEIAVGDHVLVHVGYAIQKISHEEAYLTWELLDQVLAAEV